jgi:NB-ARC domain
MLWKHLKFFLVLDDLWDDDKRSDWEKLIAPLQFVQQGSKILFTTRMKSVADMLACVITDKHKIGTSSPSRIARERVTTVIQ